VELCDISVAASSSGPCLIDISLNHVRKPRFLAWR
jgi:hypothetical protein